MDMLLYIATASLLSLSVFADLPCAVREVSGESPVCVCNETYCDDFVIQTSRKGGFVAYTSSKKGSRFKKSSGVLDNSENSSCKTTLELNLDKKYQRIEGFGGAVTDSAAIVWKSLSEKLQKYIIDSYYSEDGLQYNMIRTNIAGCDFSTRGYAFNDLPENDAQLTNYTLVPEDLDYKIPMIKAINTTSPSEVHIVASPWSPPKWMKTNNDFKGISRLKEEYYQTYATYLLKFLEKYAEQGISIWAITSGNEPINGVVPLIPINSLGWTPETMGNWIANYLGPTIRNSSFAGVKILAVDDQRYTIPLWLDKMVKKTPKALEMIDGVATHFYGDLFTPASVLDLVSAVDKRLFIINTEACEGSFPWELRKVVIGSWNRAKTYIKYILEDLNHNVTGWIDWNLCLFENGGPNWVKNYVDSPIIAYPDKGEFIKQPMFYAMGHFSKFIPRGSVRVEVKEDKPFFSSSLANAAFLTPKGTVVAVIHNSGSERDVCIKVKDKLATLQLEEDSITSIELLL